MAHQKHRSIVRAVLAAGTAVILILSTSPAHADPDDKPLPPRGADTFPVGTAADAAATAIGELGIGGFRDTFGGLDVDGKAGRLTVFATDLPRAEQLVAAGRDKLSEKDRAAVTIEVVRAPHTRVELIAAMARIWKQQTGLLGAGVDVHTLAITKGATGLTARVNDPVKAGKAFAANGIAAKAVDGVAITFEKGIAVTELSRDNDSAPYWGGTPIKWDWDWSYRCTSAFGMSAGGKEYLMTADHCFDLNDNVEDPNGDDIGFTRIRNFHDDATGIEGNVGGGVFLSNTVVDVFDRGSYSWTGQYVCQSGWTSGPNAVCSIHVETDYVEWDTGDGVHRGVYGWRCTECVSVRAGDSGGPVWAYASDGALESRGINSAGAEEVTDDAYEFIFWTETPHILSDFGGSVITTSY
jgi:hypothetical protein